MTPALLEHMRQFEVVAKVAIQSGRFQPRQRIFRMGVHKIGEEQFGLTRGQAKLCVGRAKDFVNNVSSSVSSETLLLAERKRQSKILKFAA